MRLGISFPHQVIGADPAAVRDFAQAAEGAGFAFLSAIEHVAGAHAERFAGVDTGFPAPPYLHDYPFHEPFTLFAFLAGMTSQIELVTSVLVLPQRQTVLVAKQAAQVSLLSGAGCGSAWAPGGTTRSSRRWAPTFTPGASARPSRSSCCAACGPSRW